MPRGWTTPALALVALLALTAAAPAADPVKVGGPCADKDRPSLAAVDHQPFSALLARYVDDRGLVAYAKWKADAKDRQALEDYLVRAGCVDLKKDAPRAARVAYWINVYNALTLHGVLREYPTPSIRRHAGEDGGYNIWQDLLLCVDGDWYSLDDIEHKVLRKMGDPRVHFGLVCGSKGCPPLTQQAYGADKVDQQLRDNARLFLGRMGGLKEDGDTVYLSELFDWYGKDFGDSPDDQLKALRGLLDDGKGPAGGRKPKIKFKEYDWTLNDQSPPTPAPGK